MKDKTKSASLSDTARRSIASGLAHVLADTFQLYQKTHGFHWNVEGPYFSELHLLFETQYTDLWTSVDALAERIRALGHYVPAAPSDFSALSSIKEETSVPKAEVMVAQLAEGHEAVIASIRNAYKAAEEGGDKATTALYDERLQTHEKHVWMLRSHLSQTTSGDTVEASPLKKLSE